MWREERIFLFIIIILWNSWWWRGYDNFWKLQVVHALPPSYSFSGESVVWNFCPIISCMLTYLSVSAYSFLFVSFIMKGDGCLLCIEEPCPHNPWSLMSYFFFFLTLLTLLTPFSETSDREVQPNNKCALPSPWPKSSGYPCVPTTISETPRSDFPGNYALSYKHQSWRNSSARAS